MNLTKGLGAGAKNDIGQAAADESLNEIVSYIQGSNMIFILLVWVAELEQAHLILLLALQKN